MDSGGDRIEHPKGPNFGLVVISAGVALVVIFIIALIILSIRGKRDIPLNHTHKNANALIQRPAAAGTPSVEAYRTASVIASAIVNAPTADSAARRYRLCKTGMLLL